MKKLFSKFTAIYLGILFLGYVFITIGANHLMTQTLVNQKAKKLIENAQVFTESFQAIQNLNIEKIEQVQLLQKEIIALDKYTGTDIWLMDENDHYLAVSNDALPSMEASDISDEDVRRVFSGKVVVKQMRIDSVYNDQVLMIGYPLMKEDTPFLAMFMNVTIPDIKRATTGMTIIVFISMSGMALIAMLVLLIFTRKLNNEFKELNEAVKEVAGGNFDQQIRIHRHDEMGDLAKSFNNMSRALRKLEATKQRFISNLSHDLRSPLTSITGYVRAIQDGTIPLESQGRYLDIVLKESERLKKLINDILELSKLQSGQMPLNKTDFDVNQMVLQELDRFENRIVDKRLKLHIDLSDDKFLAHADEDAMRRVVYNLLDNALKFIDDEGTLRIKSEIKSDKYLVGIQNSGAIIPKEKLEFIWDRFHKLDSSRGEEKTASGLGLAIVKEIIRAHGEKIEVYSDETVGVMFVFSVSTQIFKFTPK